MLLIEILHDTLFVRLEIFQFINHNGYTTKLRLIVMHLAGFLVLFLMETVKIFSEIVMSLLNAGTLQERGEQICIITLRIKEILEF